MTSDNPPVCSICATPLAGEYCHACGQRHTGRPARLRELLLDAVSGLVSLERSLLATLIRILRDPVVPIANYWAGNRGYFHSPGKMAFFAAFVVGLHFAFFGNQFLGLNIGVQGMPPQFGLLVVLIPLYSVSSRLTFFRGGRSLVEHLIAIVYLFSAWIVTFTALDLIQHRLLGNPLDELMVVLFMVVVFIGSARVHATERSWPARLGFAALQVLVLATIVVVTVGLLYLLVPEAVDISQ